MTACLMIKSSAAGGDGNRTGVGKSRDIGKPDTRMAEIMGLETVKGTAGETAGGTAGEIVKETIKGMIVEATAEETAGQITGEITGVAKVEAEGRMSFLKNSG
jgi:hypothetical protein